MIGTTARWLMPQLLGAVEHAHPNVHADRAGGQHDVTRPQRARPVSSTRRSSTCPSTTPNCVIEPLFAEDLLLLVHRTPSPRSSRHDVDHAELDDVPLLLPPTGAALRRVLDRAAAAHDTHLRAQAEIDGVRLLASLAIDGYGAAIVPATAVPGGSRDRSGASPCPNCPAASSPGRPAAARGERTDHAPCSTCSRELLPSAPPSSPACTSAPPRVPLGRPA